MKPEKNKSYIAKDNASLLVDSALIPIESGLVVSFDSNFNAWIGPSRKVTEVIAISGFDELD